MSHENIMRLWNDCVNGGAVRPLTKIKVKTASYTIKPVDFGTTFTTRGASATVTFTLPAVASEYEGDFVVFINVADYNMMVLGTDEEVVTFNDLTADGLGFTTTSEKIGGTVLAICDGTSWILLPIGTETQTIKVATAASHTPSHTQSPSHTVSNTPSHTQSPSHTASHSPS